MDCYVSEFGVVPLSVRIARKLRPQIVRKTRIGRLMFRLFPTLLTAKEQAALDLALTLEKQIIAHARDAYTRGVEPEMFW